jgi:D-serine deaminase-like pyridoxal phosphate-dependent protein
MLPFPTLFVDLDIVRNNIQKMVRKAAHAEVKFRPHFKTHQSKSIGRIFKEFGVKGITVSSIKMAEYFLSDGWDDITIAFPANVLAGEYYNDIASRCLLRTLVISENAIQKLDKQVDHKMGLYVEIDPHYGRSGIPIANIAHIQSVVQCIQESENFYAAGFYCHAGHSYQATSKEAVQAIGTDVLADLTQLKNEFPTLPICFGDTPCCSVLDSFGPVNQISPGNFVFYDWMQVQIGACTPSEIAVYMECPIIEKFEARRQVLIHGGAVHFSKESIQLGQKISFGQPVLSSFSSETYLKSISQEHGIIQCNTEDYSSLNIGDIIRIYPIHSCLTADLMREYHTKDGRVLDHMNGC